MRLSASDAVIAAGGGLPIQATLKQMLDLLVTAKFQISNTPIYAIVKGGIAYRQLQLEDRNFIFRLCTTSEWRISSRFRLQTDRARNDHSALSRNLFPVTMLVSLSMQLATIPTLITFLLSKQAFWVLSTLYNNGAIKQWIKNIFYVP